MLFAVGALVVALLPLLRERRSAPTSSPTSASSSIALLGLERPHRLHGPDLARPRRVHGDRRATRPRSSRRDHDVPRPLDDPARGARRRRGRASSSASRRCGSPASTSRSRRSRSPSSCPRSRSTTGSRASRAAAAGSCSTCRRRRSASRSARRTGSTTSAGASPACCFVAAWLLLRGRTGRALRAIRENEIAAVSSGIGLPTYKTLAFGVSAFYARRRGLALRDLDQLRQPGHASRSRSRSCSSRASSSAGSARSRGVLFGALFIQFLPIYAPDDARRPLSPFGRSTVDTTASGAPAVVYGFVLLGFLLLAPAGVAGLFDRLARALPSRRNGRMIAAGTGSPPQGERDERRLVLVVAARRAVSVSIPGAFGGTARRRRSIRSHGAVGHDRRHVPDQRPGGAYAPIAKGMQAYFSYINARRAATDKKRGVYGRQIVFKVYDDQYNPAQTVQLTRRLVEQDKVFAIVGGLGTEPQTPVRPYLNQQKVPQLYVSTGATTWGRDRAPVPVDDRLAARLPVRGEGLRPVHPHEARRTRRWRSCSRTTTTARTTSPASSPPSAPAASSPRRATR